MFRYFPFLMIFKVLSWSGNPIGDGYLWPLKPGCGTYDLTVSLFDYLLECAGHLWYNQTLLPKVVRLGSVKAMCMVSWLLGMQFGYKIEYVLHGAMVTPTLYRFCLFNVWVSLQLASKALFVYSRQIEQLKQKNLKNKSAIPFRIERAYSGSTLPLSFGCRTCCCPPCSGENRMAVAVGHTVLVTRGHK